MGNSFPCKRLCPFFLSLLLQGTDYTFYEGQVLSNRGLQFRSYSLKSLEKNSLMQPESPRPEEKSWDGKGSRGLGECLGEGRRREGHLCCSPVVKSHSVC